MQSAIENILAQVGRCILFAISMRYSTHVPVRMAPFGTLQKLEMSSRFRTDALGPMYS